MPSGEAFPNGTDATICRDDEGRLIVVKIRGERIVNASKLLRRQNFDELGKGLLKHFR
jgi:hypothetical protein